MTPLEEKLNNVKKSLSEDHDSYNRVKQARSFIKNCLIPENLDEADAISYIKIEMKEAFNFNGKSSKSIIPELVRYYKDLTKKYAAICLPNGTVLTNKQSKGNQSTGVCCDCADGLDIDPQDIDYDEKDIDPKLIEKAEKAAERILTRGNPIKYIMKTVAKTHVGDENTIEALCISCAGQSVLNTDGIQIAVNGDSGSGKSHGAKSFLHNLPAKWKRSTSLSAKALYYMELREGMTIYSDDTDMDPELATIFKQSTTNYQETTYRVTVKDQKRNVVTIPPRLNLVLTCVESHVSDQVLNRQLVFETDISGEQKRSIYLKQKEIELKRINRLSVTFRVLVCRRIFSIIKAQQFNVCIPFVDKINILDYSNSRIQPLILDMIRSFAMFKFKQRKIDSEGWLIATKEDFYNAKRLFKTREENTVTKLTKPEREIVKYIINHQKHDGCTVNDIAVGTGLRNTTVHRLINGRNDRTNDDGGLLSKVQGMRKEDTTVTNYIKEDGELIQSTGKKDNRYKIMDYDPWELFDYEFIELLE